jgi:hypothetical protein
MVGVNPRQLNYYQGGLIGSVFYVVNKLFFNNKHLQKLVINI